MRRMGVSVLSSTLITLVVYPLDTMKRVAQVNGARGFFNSYLGSREIFDGIKSKYGTRGFYRGARLYLLTTLLSSFAQFTLYDQLFDSFQKK